MLNKKLKMTATVLNILQVIPIVILEIFLFMILTYNNNVALNYIPVRLSWSNSINSYVCNYDCNERWSRYSNWIKSKDYKRYF